MSPLSIGEAKRFYDRFGEKQDKQGWYEAPALDDLISHADFDSAHAVFEFGCGTGRVAAELLSHRLPPTAEYLGVDLSATMIELASRRLSRFPGRARVTISSGDPKVPVRSRSIDRFLSTYVLDLLPPAVTREVLTEAHRVLEPGGLLCLAGITPGATALSSVTMALWRVLYAIDPFIVGGCRPIHLADYVSGPEWTIRHRRVVVSKGIASEVLVAEASGASA